MAESCAGPVSSTTFCLEIPKVSQLNKFFSPEISVQGTIWYVELVKFDSGGTWCLYYCLHRKNTDQPTSASILIKLLSWNNDNSFQKDLSCVFKKPVRSYRDCFILWNKLFANENGFVLNDTIKIEIVLRVSNQNDESSSIVKCLSTDECCVMGCSATARFQITNIRNLVAVRLPMNSLDKLHWKLTFFKNILDQLGTRIDAKDMTESAVNMSIKILSTKMTDSIGQSGTIDDFVYNGVIQLDELLKPENELSHNDSITIEVQTKARCRSFDDDSLDETNRKKFKMECALCQVTITNQNVLSTPCGHLYCTICINIKVLTRKSCPLCKYPITLETLTDIINMPM